MSSVKIIAAIFNCVSMTVKYRLISARSNSFAVRLLNAKRQVKQFGRNLKVELEIYAQNGYYIMQGGFYDKKKSC